MRLKLSFGHVVRNNFTLTLYLRSLKINFWFYMNILVLLTPLCFIWIASHKNNGISSIDNIIL